MANERDKAAAAYLVRWYGSGDASKGDGVVTATRRRVVQGLRAGQIVPAELNAKGTGVEIVADKVDWTVGDGLDGR